MIHDLPEDEEEARNILASFLCDVPDPDGLDLVRLLEDHPQHAAALERLMRQRDENAALLEQGLAAAGEESAPVTLEAGARIADFELVRRLGKGGMGEVWEAHELGLDRRVALKILDQERVGPRGLAMFDREARAGARLQHPGIVTVHGTGMAAGVAWISMELVPGGRTLADWIVEQEQPGAAPVTAGAAALVIARIAEALEAAHAADVIHRDIKPANVLLTPEGDPKVTDFGLARITSEAALTQTGEFAGTYYYMSPEQAAARRAGIDHLTDVFSLGSVFYECLAGRRPFTGDTTHQVTQQVLFEDPPALSTIRSQLPDELATICAKALEKNPRDRYLTMGAFAADLRRHLADEPILARPAGPLRRLTKWCRRRPAVATASGIGSVAIVTIVVLAVAALRSADRARAEARRAEATVEFLESMIELADPDLARGGPVTARALLEQGSRDAAERFADDPLVQARVERGLGRAFASIGAPDLALQHLESARTALALMPDEPEELARGVAIATVGALTESGENARALELVTELRNGPGAGVPLTPSEEYGLATGAMAAALGLAEWDRAEEEARRARDAAQDPEAFTAAERISASMNLASVSHARGDFATAAERYDSLLEEARTTLGEGDRLTCMIEGNLGACMYELGRYAEAVPLLQHSADGRETLYGRDHPLWLTVAQTLAMNLAATGDAEGGSALLDEVLERRSRVLGPEHPDTLSSRMSRAVLQVEAGLDLERALEDTEAVATARREALGTEHPDTLNALYNQSNLLKQLGRAEEGLTLMREVWRTQAATVGAEHPDTLFTQTNLGLFEAEEGDLEGGIILIREAHELRARVQGRSHPYSLGALFLLVQLEAAGGDAEEARRLGAMLLEDTPEDSPFRAEFESVVNDLE